MRRTLLPIGFVLLVVGLVAVGVLYGRTTAPTAATPVTTPSVPAAAAVPPAPSGALAASGASVGASGGVPAPSGSAGPAALASNPHPDLAIDESGLSKATVTLTTSQGVIKFKFYPQDAPNTVNRIVELINQGFYNGLSWHRVVPGFVIQGGDPQGNGTGGSGQKLKAEFNNRRHIEGAVAMARGADKDSADSQFYIALGTFPHLDHSYTVFGQVVEGLDAARKIKVGDKIVSMIVQ